MKAVYFGLWAFLCCTLSLAQAQPCPTNEAAWVKWRNEVLQLPITYTRFRLETERVFTQCTYPASLKGCLDPLKSLSETVVFSLEHSLGSASAFSSQFETVSSDPASIGADVLDFETEKKLTAAEVAKRVLKKFPQAQVIEYTSTLFGKSPTVIVRVVRGGHESWLHLADPDGKYGKALTFGITPAIRPDENPKIRFGLAVSGSDLDFMGGLRSRGEAHLAKLRAHQVPYRPDQASCLSCHRTGPMAILPAQGTAVSHTPGMTADEVIKAMNRRTKELATAEGEVPFKKFGPALGPEDREERTDAFIAGCSSPELPEASRQKIKSAMRCTRCHDGSVAGPQGGSPAETGIMLDWVFASRHMPPKPPLTDDERKSLASCLMAEYFGGFAIDAQDVRGAERPGILLESAWNSPCGQSGNSDSAPAPKKGTVGPAK